MHVEHMGQKFDAQKGDVVLIDCSNPHYYQAENGLEFTFIHFDGSNSHEIVEHILSVRGPLIRSKTICSSVISSIILSIFTKTEVSRTCLPLPCAFTGFCRC